MEILPLTLFCRSHIMPCEGGMNMRVALQNADVRFRFAAEALRQEGYDAFPFENASQLSGVWAVVAKYPLQKDWLEILQKEKPRLILLNACELQEEWPSEVCLLSEDEAFVSANADVTAEGAIFSAMSRMDVALKGEKALVVGYGRIGKALTEKLQGLGAQVTVCSRREQGRLQAMARGAQAMDISELSKGISEYRSVYVTSPTPIIKEAIFSRASEKTVFVDVSSAPYGMDLEAAHRFSLNAVRENGLPPRYAPETASRIFTKAVLSKLEVWL